MIFARAWLSDQIASMVLIRPKSLVTLQRTLASYLMTLTMAASQVPTSWAVSVAFLMVATATFVGGILGPVLGSRMFD